MINYLDINEFADFGYLQEVNRLFFHPLGLALEITIEDDGSAHLSGIWDYRDDPEGIIFEKVDGDKLQRVNDARIARKKGRQKALGYFIQPELIEDEM
jgi:hypothetical protein